jgi:hypothetical protein
MRELEMDLTSFVEEKKEKEMEKLLEELETLEKEIESMRRRHEEEIGRLQIRIAQIRQSANALKKQSEKNASGDLNEENEKNKGVQA